MRKMREVFLDKLPRTHKNKIDWINSIGTKVKFTYDDINGEIDIVNYENGYLFLKYLDFPIYKLTVSRFINSQITRLIKKRTYDFKINIGTIINDLTIIDREYRKQNNAVWKFYKYKCNICGYEGWKVEYSFNNYKGCACCTGKVVVKGKMISIQPILG